jgi:L-fuculose-phosphate aldolase
MLDHLALREQLLATGRRMNTSGLNHGTSGNLSARVPGGLLVTPTGMDYDDLEPEDLVFLDLDGRPRGRRLPSSEWRFHRDILAARPEIGAVLHAHPIACTAVACLRREIPPFHYMVAVAGGSSIRCAPYATFGTEELSRHALAAIDGRRACLLANHGLLVAAPDLPAALKIAVEIEALAAMFLRALAAGEPVLLTDHEMAVVLEKFHTYGQQPAVPQEPSPPGK